jgi:hypothetical protein
MPVNSHYDETGNIRIGYSAILFDKFSGQDSRVREKKSTDDSSDRRTPHFKRKIPPRIHYIPIPR